jgi:Dihydrodipicolinate reductase, N-terminus
MEIPMNKLRVCVAGATGWAGPELSREIFKTTDMELVAALSRSNAGKTLREAPGIADLKTPVFARLLSALLVILSMLLAGAMGSVIMFRNTSKHSKEPSFTLRIQPVTESNSKLYNQSGSHVAGSAHNHTVNIVHFTHGDLS